MHYTYLKLEDLTASYIVVYSAAKDVHGIADHRGSMKQSTCRCGSKVSGSHHVPPFSSQIKAVRMKQRLNDCV